jgi:hypothetical protein
MSNDNVKYQVFISSTYNDLIEDRQTAIIAILDAGHIPAGMELFKAGIPVLRTIYNWIDESDIFLNIFGGRYGSLDIDSGRSYSQLEYEYALMRGKPVFSLLLGDAELHRRSDLDPVKYSGKENRDKLLAFKQLIEKNVCSYYNNSGELKYEIQRNLSNIIQSNALTGWVRAQGTNEEITSKNNIAQTYDQDIQFKKLISMDSQVTRLKNFYASLGLSRIFDRTGEWIPFTASTPVSYGAPNTWESHPAIFISKWIDIDGIRTEAGIKYAYCPALNQGAKIVTKFGQFIVEQLFDPK